MFILLGSNMAVLLLLPLFTFSDIKLFMSTVSITILYFIIGCLVGLGTPFIFMLSIEVDIENKNKIKLFATVIYFIFLITTMFFEIAYAKDLNPACLGFIIIMPISSFFLFIKAVSSKLKEHKGKFPLRYK